MRRSTKILAAVGLAMILGLPVMGMALASHSAPITARTLDRAPLDMKLLPPLLKRTTWYGGAVIPVIILVTDPEGGSYDTVAEVNATLWVNDMPATSPGKSMIGNNFTYLGEGIFQFNLATKPYPAGPGSQPIKLDIIVKSPDDRTSGLEVFIALR